MPEVVSFEIPKNEDATTFRNVIAAAYTAWVANKRGVLPAVEDVLKYCQHTSKVVGRIMTTPEFAAAMRDRGLPWATDGTYLNGLTAEQNLCLSIITRPDKRDMTAKLKSAGVPYAKYRAWLKNPIFRRAVESITEDAVQAHIGDIETALINKATGGDVRAIQLALELSGRHDPATKQMADLRAILGLLLEIITVHVTDPVVLENLSKDIQQKIGPTIMGETMRSIG